MGIIDMENYLIDNLKKHKVDKDDTICIMLSLYGKHLSPEEQKLSPKRSQQLLDWLDHHPDANSEDIFVYMEYMGY